MKHLRAILVFVVLMYVFFFVWPGMWLYGTLGRIPIRWHRVTSQMEYLSLQGWQPQLPVMNEDEPSTFQFRPTPTPTPNGR